MKYSIVSHEGENVGCRIIDARHGTFRDDKCECGSFYFRQLMEKTIGIDIPLICTNCELAHRFGDTGYLVPVKYDEGRIRYMMYEPKEYAERILNYLTDKAIHHNFADVPKEKWIDYSFSSLTMIYNCTGGRQRYNIISAIGTLISDNNTPLRALISLVYFVRINDLSQLVSSAEKLQENVRILQEQTSAFLVSRNYDVSKLHQLGIQE